MLVEGPPSRASRVGTYLVTAFSQKSSICPARPSESLPGANGWKASHRSFLREVKRLEDARMHRGIKYEQPKLAKRTLPDRQTRLFNLPISAGAPPGRLQTTCECAAQAVALAAKSERLEDASSDRVLDPLPIGGFQ
jgi:hypothetical protein